MDFVGFPVLMLMKFYLETPFLIRDKRRGAKLVKSLFLIQWNSIVVDVQISLQLLLFLFLDLFFVK